MIQEWKLIGLLFVLGDGSGRNFIAKADTHMNITFQYQEESSLVAVLRRPEFTFGFSHVSI